MTTFTNDLYGRRTSRITPSGTTTYTWDPSGHLSCVTSADTTVTYAYGITGMRESKTIETTSGTTQTKSVWDGSALAAEQDSDGTVYRYLWGPDRTPLSVAVEYSTGATETFSYHVDALGSVVAMTDGSGSVVARYSYDPYGRCTAATGEEIATRSPLRYRAYYADAETGLFYLPARYYDPQTYRFLSQDPAAPSAGDPLSLNAYAYCLGDPVGASDPSGAITDWDGDGKASRTEVGMHNETSKQAAAGRSGFYTSAGRAWRLVNGRRLMAQGLRDGVKARSDLNTTYGLLALSYYVGGVALSWADGPLPFGDAAGAGAITAGTTALTAIGDPNDEAAALAEPFSATGELADAAIGQGRMIIPGDKIVNQRVVDALTQNGGSMGDWGKYTTPWYSSPAGRQFQIHYYFNASAGSADYSIDYKSVFR